jgi:hypothetical protein
MPKLVNKSTGRTVMEGSYGKGKQAEEERKKIYGMAKNSPDLEVQHGKKTYQAGGLASRKPEKGRMLCRGDKISKARGRGFKIV